MKTQSARKRFVVLLVATAWAGIAFACTVAEENPGNPRPTRVTPGGDGSTPAGEETKPLGSPICDKYGGVANVGAMANKIINRAMGDCRIGTPISGLNPRELQHFQECFQIQLEGAFQCAGVSYAANVSKDTGGQPCRSMQQAHQEYNLRLADYNAFLEAVAAELTANSVALEDQRNIAPVFEGQKNSIVRVANQPDKNTHCSCPNGLYNGVDCTADQPIIDAGNDVKDTGVDTGNDGGAQDAGDGG